MLPARSGAFLCYCQIVAFEIMAALHTQSFIIPLKSAGYFRHSSVA